MKLSDINDRYGYFFFSLKSDLSISNPIFPHALNVYISELKDLKISPYLFKEMKTKTFQKLLMHKDLPADFSIPEKITHQEDFSSQLCITSSMKNPHQQKNLLAAVIKYLADQAKNKIHTTKTQTHTHMHM